jgi:hypothetical protein
MRTVIILAFTLFSYFSYAKKIDVKVTIQNLTGDSVLVNFNVGSNVADPSASVFISKTLPPTGEIQWTFQTGKNIENFAVVYGSAILIKNGAPSGRITGDPRVVSKDNNNYSWDIQIDDSNRRSLDDLSSQILQYEPRNFINNDLSPKPLNGLFNQFLGALQAYRITSEDTIYEYRVAPIDLELNAKIGEIVGTQTSNRQIDFANVIEQEVGVSIPVITELGIGFSFDRMHSIKLEYKNIGVVDWVKTASMNQKATTDLLKEDMPSADQIELGRLYAKYGDSMKLQRIDKAYIFDGIYLEHKEGTETNATNEIDVSTFVTNAGTFKFTNSNVTSKVFGTSYLGYWIGETSPNFGALLEYFEAVYSAQIPKLLTDRQLKEEYEKLREANPNLQELNTTSEIRLFYNQKLREYIRENPSDQTNKLLSSRRIGVGSSLIDRMSDNELDQFIERMRNNFEFIPEDADNEQLKDMFKKLEDIDPNLKKKLEENNFDSFEN